MLVEDNTELTLASSTLDEYAHAVQRAKYNELWWYTSKLVLYRHSSSPFQDSEGRWWYHVKPHFAYAVDFSTVFEDKPVLPWNRAMLGRQYRVASDKANSVVKMNVIEDLSNYDIHSVASNKRRAVRKGLKNLVIRSVDPSDKDVQVAALDVWNSHVERTGWNRTFNLLEFQNSWTELASMPGTTVLAAYDPSLDGKMCAWTILRVFAETVWIDTIASHTDRQANRPNDALIFLSLKSASQMAGVRQAHYSLVSDVESLEKFKRSLGFSIVEYSARLEVLAPIGLGLRVLRPRIWRRLKGAFPSVLLGYTLSEL